MLPVRSFAVAGACALGLATACASDDLSPGSGLRNALEGEETPAFLEAERDLDEALKSEIVAKTALKRSGSPDDIARTALFLATEGPYVTGQIIAVDGGRSL